MIQKTVTHISWYNAYSNTIQCDVISSFFCSSLCCKVFFFFWIQHRKLWGFGRTETGMKNHSVKYPFSELLIQWNTHSVNYSFSEILIQLNSRLCWVGRKQSKFIWTVRRSLWYSYGLKTPVQLCFIRHFQTPVSRLIFHLFLLCCETRILGYLLLIFIESFMHINYVHVFRKSWIKGGLRNLMIAIRFTSTYFTA